MARSKTKSRSKVLLRLWILELIQAVSASMKFGHTDVSTT